MASLRTKILFFCQVVFKISSFSILTAISGFFLVVFFFFIIRVGITLFKEE